ncbi:LLM class F420-dependent oxidoreductase [Nocardiopsis changdeensis]|uniref:LLM class F420-dependent oxidoreductase n=1 Tax=Nocardiopsis changdeensis TaxID=2831969 RepID=A0ABX8BQ08_9ACTN|nr:MULTISPECIES: LLM class F420-dependent oxidoreductase [Nocardiopsis]QUX24320.1 LLM class F420-dependent oxidoreductase [Nocardiopsis changdeensis]QYX34711.1 LLM class F420-dependent oxidoreductase [Nocardiopsis sp. MT53]
MTSRWGMTVPLEGIPLPDQRAVIERMPDQGYTDLWSAEAGSTDAFTPLALASVWAPDLRLGTAIVPAYTRGPATLAMSAATLAAAAPGRFALGLGTSSNIIVERWNAVPFTEPYKKVRDTVRFLREAFTGARVKADYDTFSVQGFTLGAVPPQAPPILVAALRPGMLRLAGREADGAIINWLSAEDVRTVVPYVHEQGEGKEIVARIFVIPEADPDTARGIGRRAIAAYLNVPVYRAFHEWLGREELAPMWKAWEEGDRKGALAAIPDAVVDELIVHGPAGYCRERVAAYVENGVTTPALAPILPPGADPARAVRALAPRD